MLGLYDNFPENIQLKETYSSGLSPKKLQATMIRVLGDFNRKTFTFEQLGSPTVPNSTVIFEFGIADEVGFNYIDGEESAKLLNEVSRKALPVLDLFCSIRYYKSSSGKKTPLKFDYYLLRWIFSKDNVVETQVFHERGPRYISPADLIALIVKSLNEFPGKKALKPPQVF